jgi:hypothetical protein
VFAKLNEGHFWTRSVKFFALLSNKIFSLLKADLRKENLRRDFQADCRIGDAKYRSLQIALNKTSKKHTFLCASF